MPDVHDLLAKAQALGQALAAHPLVRAYHAAQRAVRTDATARTLLSDYQTQLNRIRQLEAELQPVEVADKQRLKELESRMAGHESLKMLMRTQADYVALMAQINSAIDAPLAELDAAEQSA